MFDFKDTAVFMSKAATYHILHGMVFGTEISLIKSTILKNCK